MTRSTGKANGEVGMVTHIMVSISLANGGLTLLLCASICCYEGWFVNGKRNGKGNFVGRHGDRYVGEWKNNKKHGRGSWRGNGFEYDGMFVHGRPLKKKYCGMFHFLSERDGILLGTEYLRMVEKELYEKISVENQMCCILIPEQRGAGGHEEEIHEEEIQEEDEELPSLLDLNQSQWERNEATEIRQEDDASSQP